MPPPLRRAALALLCLLAAPPLHAQLRGVRLASDNDVYRFWIPYGERLDFEYTNGLELEAELEGAPLWGRLVPGARACGAGDSVPCAVSTLAAGQKIFTPRLDTDTLLDGQRPYAGWLYLSAGAVRATRHARREAGLEVGVTGPPSGAEWVQTTVHRLGGFWQPAGWGGQIPFRPAFALRYDERHRALAPGRRPVAELVPAWGASLGTLRTELRAGGRVRLGLLDAPWPGAGGRRVAALYAVAGATGRAVARDLFLDVGPGGAHPRVERIPLVGEWEAGVGARLRGLRAEFRVETRTRAYRSEPYGHQFVTLDVWLQRRW